VINAETLPIASGDRRASSPNLRVAHVAAYSEASASGVDKTVLGLVTNLEQYGVLPEVWHLNHSHPFVAERQDHPIKVIELPAYPRARSALLGVPEATRRFISERRDVIDVLHLHSVFIPDNVWVAKLAGRPYVLTPNGGYSPRVISGHNRIAKAVWMRIRERNYVQGASLVHAVSPPELGQLRSMFGARSLVYAPNAIDLPPALVSPEERMLRSQRRVLFLGRLAVDHKGLDVLLEGYARYVRGQRDPETELIVAGPDFRSGRTKLEALASSRLPRGGVRFLDAVFGEDKDSLLRSAYVFVHTSRWEGMPYAVLEALATGCPVLLTAATNLGDFVEEFGAGIVVECTPEAVSDGLARLLHLPAARYQAMCSAAGKLAAERFTWPAVAEHISTAYRSILE
jgi:glycosyltransferase involved in cell wall biosynthesis